MGSLPQIGLAGCGGQSPPPKASPTDKPAPALHVGPLSDYVASAGLRWMVIGRPREIVRDGTLAKAIGRLLPDSGLEAFSRSSGVDLRHVDSALAAGFDFGTLYMVEAPGSVGRMQTRFENRIVTGAIIKRPHPELTRVAGLIGTTPESLVRIDHRVAAVAVGSPTPARVVELFALKKLKRSPRALAGSALKSLPTDELEKAPARFYAPGPFQDEWATGAHGLLRTATALGVAARPAGEGRIAFTVAIAGDFHDPKGDPATRLQDAWNELAASGMGHLLGLNQPASGPTVSGTPDLLRLNVELDSEPLANGLRAAVKAEVWEFLDLSPKKP